MSNPRFYAGELDGCTYTMSLSENSSYPLSNLHTYIPTDLWISSGTTANQTLNIDMDSIVLARNSVIIEGHNFNAIAATGIYLQYDAADNPSFSNPVTAATLSSLGNGRLKITFTGASRRYWRILFSGSLSAAPQLGNLFIAAELDTGFTYVYPYSERNEDTPSVVRRSVSGLARSTRIYGAITRWKIVFDLMDDTFRTAWLRFYQKVVGKTPFYYYDTDDIGWLVFFSDEVELETFHYQRNRTTQLNMETQSVGQNPL